MNKRDYAKEMHALIEKRLSADSYVAPLVATSIVEELNKSDKDLLAGWLDLHAVDIVRDTVNRIGQSKRALARKSETRSAFAKHIKDLENGEKVGRWLSVTYRVNDEGKNSRLALLTAEELDYAIADYEQRAAANSFEALFLTAIRERVDNDATVEDCLTEDEIEELRKKISTDDDE